MEILFIRHGNPNYELDCLTELGKIQAEAVSERLIGEGIEAIYSSTCGRAFETAEYTAKKYGYDVHPCDFMREISWGSITDDPNDRLHPWYYADRLVGEGRSVLDFDIRTNVEYNKCELPASCERASIGVDGWLSELGFLREGDYYRVGKVKYEKVAMFCHGGTFAVSMARIFNLTIPFTMVSFPMRQTAIARIELLSKEGELVNPRFLCVNDVAHLVNCGIELTD